jgi:hypothetical protein
MRSDVPIAHSVKIPEHQHFPVLPFQSGESVAYRSGKLIIEDRQLGIRMALSGYFFDPVAGGYSLLTPQHIDAAVSGSRQQPCPCVPRRIEQFWFGKQFDKQVLAHIFSSLPVYEYGEAIRIQIPGVFLDNQFQYCSLPLQSPLIP